MLDKLKKVFNLDSNVPREETFYPLMNTNYNVEKLSRTDYLSLYTGWVYVATTTISDSIAGLETWTFVNDEEQDHKYKDLIDYNFIKKVSSFMLLNGNCFVYKDMIGESVDSLHILRPDLVKIEEYADWSLKGYRYNGHGKNELYYPDEIINFSMFSPWETYPSIAKGVSPVEAVAIQAEMDKTANKWNWNFFKNGASVKDIIKSDKKVSKEAQKRFVDKWKSEFQWVNNSHKVAFLDQWVNYDSIWAKQKELDFVESRRFTRDEILAIYKVPKAIIGITDDVNRASATVAENTFYKTCIWPLAKQIEERLTEDLFNNEVEYRFINVVPQDTEQLLEDLNNGAITINEYRQKTGYEPLENGDVLKLDQSLLVPSEWAIEQEEKSHKYSDIVKNTIKKNTKGTEEYKKSRQERKEKIRRQKIQRTNKYELAREQAINEVFEIQKSDLIQWVKKWYTKAKKPEFNSIKYKAIWRSTLRPLFENVMRNEGTEANTLIGVQDLFDIGNPEINKYIRDNIERVAKDVDNTTKNKIFDIIEQGNEEWLGAEDIRNNISSEFENFKDVRSSTIARTEITRASNEASQIAYREGGVEFKEYLAELDGRTSDICRNLNGKIVKIWENFADEGETIAGFKLDYEDIEHPPTHPNCRSTLIPVLD